MREISYLLFCYKKMKTKERGHQISCLNDFMELYERPYGRSTVENLLKLPHPTIQKFGIINVVVVGASRRFLAQITRHQKEVKYMSASLQYSDYSGYRGQVHAIISNVGNKEYEIKAGDKIGQLVMLPVVIPEFTFENWEERGTGAFGSTGR